ncbi:hypothetical protein GCM10022377_13870 [Zhihengliuella alba]|uniref:Uncharacterized protein n=1 Tax=Zhihengliuella alba TaxID=547018 RepID=A0ABP7D9S2_9MICC
MSKKTRDQSDPEREEPLGRDARRGGDDSEPGRGPEGRDESPVPAPGPVDRTESDAGPQGLPRPVPAGAVAGSGGTGAADDDAHRRDLEEALAALGDDDEAPATDGVPNGDAGEGADPGHRDAAPSAGDPPQGAAADRPDLAPAPPDAEPETSDRAPEPSDRAPEPSEEAPASSDAPTQPASAAAASSTTSPEPTPEPTLAASEPQTAEPETRESRAAEPEASKAASEPAPERAPDAARHEAAAPKAAPEAEAPRRSAAVAGTATAGSRRAQREKRRRTRRLIAAAVGAGLVIVAGGGVTAASLLPTPNAAVDLGVTQATVPAGDTVLSCAPEPRIVEGTTAEGSDPQFAPESETASSPIRATVVSDAAQRLPGAAVSALGGDVLQQLAERIPEDQAAEASGSSAEGYTGQTAETASGVDHPGWAVLRAQPLGGLKSLAGMSRSFNANDGDLAGYAATTCQAPSNDQWITGVSTQVGRTGLLTLANPSESAATVDLELIGTTGRADAANLRGIVLAPGETRSIVLAGMIPDDPAVSVHVTSTGAAVNAVVQQSVLRGLTPGGVDYLHSGASAGRQQTVPGIVVQAPEDRAPAEGDYADAVPQLQVANPSTVDAELNLRVFGPSGEVEMPGGATVTAAADSVTGLSLAELPEGTYTVAIQSSESVVAGARSVRAGSGEDGAPTDFAWAPSAARLANQHVMVPPQLGDTALVLASAGGESTVEVRPIAADGTIGEARTIEIQPTRTETLALDDLGEDTAAVLIDSAGEPVYAAQRSLTDGGHGISVLPVPPPSEGQRNIAVDIVH